MGRSCVGQIVSHISAAEVDFDGNAGRIFRYAGNARRILVIEPHVSLRTRFIADVHIVRLAGVEARGGEVGMEDERRTTMFHKTRCIRISGKIERQGKSRKIERVSDRNRPGGRRRSARAWRRRFGRRGTACPGTVDKGIRGIRGTSVPDKPSDSSGRGFLYGRRWIIARYDRRSVIGQEHCDLGERCRPLPS